MNIREMLTSGIFSKPVSSKLKKVQDKIVTYWDNFSFSDNGFRIKSTTKATRMEKSVRARANRKQIKHVKQRHLDESHHNAKWYSKKVH